MIYFDYAATCPLDKDAASAYIKVAANYFANSNSLHDMGGTVQSFIEQCRSDFASLLGVDKEGIYFTSGGSESNFLTIQALLSEQPKNKNHIITTLAEHSSIHSTMKILEKQGYEIDYLPVMNNGLIDLELFEKRLNENTALVSIHHVNSETGAIQPIEEIGSICKKHGVLFHSDFVQSFGKLPLTSFTNMLDGFSLSSHKFYGPKGVGVAYINPKHNWEGYYPGTTHENGFRPGTLNTAGIVSMTVAAQKAHLQLEGNQFHFKQLRNAFLQKTKGNSSIHVIECAQQLPSIIGLRVKNMEGQWVMLESNRRGYAISTGSACQVGQQTPSKSMKAMGFSDEQAKEFVRISFGKDTTIEEVEQYAQLLKEMIAETSS
ncbi:IscS subfamily cysteine desulfurase [Niallia sp. 01092]|uniref:IscS subfamily cysteine desulfurase n=1 Tax=unclassified Niallia TaxID=2837522 RepID=UPI003FD00713